MSGAWDLPREGGCRCGRLRFRVSAPPLVASACHCRGCQRMTASAFSLSAAIPAEGFEVIAGEPVRGGLREAAQHWFCGWCMSWAFTRVEGMDWFVNIRATLLDDPAGFAEPFVETCRAEGLAWVETGATRSYPGLPPLEDWEGLMRDFRAERG